MVGVPGKSKGCRTCRRRKKGCDQKRPVCGQCISSGYVCGGYQRDLTFIPHPATKALENAIFVPVRLAPPRSTANSSLQRSLITAQCRSLFFEVFMPWGRCLCRDEQILRCRHPMNITEVIPYIPKDEASLEAAFSALSISRVGRNKHDQRLVKESTKFYGKALKGLQKTLTQPGRMLSEHVLAACLLLTYYEVFEDFAGQSLGWASHAQGSARVLQLRGPHAHQTETAHHLFLAARVPILYSCMLQRKRTFLEEKEWLEIPWQNARFRTGVDILIDICVKLPGLMEDFDHIKANVPVIEQRNRLISCLEACMSVQQGLKIWEIRRKPAAAPIIKIHDTEDPSDDYPFQQEIIFANHLFFHANLVFWSSHLLLATTIAELQMLIAEVSNPRLYNAQAISIAQEQAHQAATNIAQAIPYGLLPDMGDLGISHITFPMSLVQSYFLSINKVDICKWLSRMQNPVKHTSLNTGFIGKQALAQTFESNNRKTSVGEDSDIGNDSGIEIKSEYTRSTSWDADFPSRFTFIRSGSKSHNSSVARSDGSSPAKMQATAQSHVPDDFDPDYDAESDIEASSPIAHSYSSGRRQGSLVTVSKQLQQLQQANASRGKFTFIEEDPSSHYIVSHQEREREKSKAATSKST